MNLFIKFFSEDDLERGRVNYSLKPIIETYSNILWVSKDDISQCLASFAPRDYGQHYIKELKVKDIDIVEGRIIIKFDIIDELDITSKEANARAWHIAVREGFIKREHLLPLISIITDDQLDEIIYGRYNLYTGKSRSNIEKLDELKQKNDWLGIYKLFEPIDQIKNKFNDIWNDSEILNNIAFACAKLAQIGDVPKDKKEKEKYLKEKAKYRKEAELIRKRCIELNPDNPTYLSNLGYLYYHNVQELTRARGRKDGNVIDEINRAIEYIGKALIIDDTRIKDHYRKGYLLTEKLPDQLYYGPANNRQLADIKRDEGIKELEKVIIIWENLDDFDTRQSREKSRCRKEYIKSIYHLGEAYYDKFRMSRYWRNVFYSFVTNNKGYLELLFSNYDVGNLKKSQKFFVKCWDVELESDIDIKNISEINKASKEWVYNAVDKLYRLGIINLDFYWVIKNNPKYNETTKLKFLTVAEQYLKSSLLVKWNDNNERKPKDYVAEKLARVYISRGDYNKAVDIIKKYCNRKIKSYIVNTLSLALYLMNNYDEVIKYLQGPVRDKHNKNKEQSIILLGYAYMKLNKYDKAIKTFKLLDEEGYVSSTALEISENAIEECMEKSEILF
ncbi:hypothetical protein TR13x_08445 [Caloranaerobacter sp. TR13]|uniref:tetratricopeptide repeat protein n=1 Tax=Caloranaerobacter sp. TR13 TaxID=1302151 RepID=UPI0006D406E5|nr:hypothetical protein [Caloranaerobacter sp. TR13]KPU26804.1 hypothetical protein TR13x_08445 [Caloranaerobacter sp. TR13]